MVPCSLWVSYAGILRSESALQRVQGADGAGTPLERVRNILRGAGGIHCRIFFFSKNRNIFFEAVFSKCCFCYGRDILELLVMSKV